MEVSKSIVFDRKIYNYFDLPKGYQITQQKLPLATLGYLPVIREDGIEEVPIKVLQIEEDTAKSSYDTEGVKLDFNRAGNPLVELVTEPVFQTLEDVSRFVKQLQNLLRYLEVSEAKMEKGQLRIDLNVSLQLGDKYSTPRYEIKNLNSLANIEKAMKYEIKKHQLLFSQGKNPPFSQTLGFDEAQQATVSHREKTTYFYLPEVNIPPIRIKPNEIKKIKELKQSDPKLAQEVNKNPPLLKIFNFLEKKKFLTKEEYKEKKLENEEIKAIIKELIETKKPFAALAKKYEKTTKVNENLLEQELKNL
ncbi:12252_t:CDS:2 [Ambispora leptoticha]|uniref:12252_t:CDS:1 n=1 Tax=Ambispora leptoticha TaxID=144679 RepID=A0A9N8Z2A7_9GLOM|nr:12252_t:CDS:2 [Ambispora leptoticha]